MSAKFAFGPGALGQHRHPVGDGRDPERDLNLGPPPSRVGDTCHPPVLGPPCNGPR